MAGDERELLEARLDEHRLIKHERCSDSNPCSRYKWLQRALAARSAEQPPAQSRPLSERSVSTPFEMEYFMRDFAPLSETASPPAEQPRGEERGATELEVETRKLITAHDFIVSADDVSGKKVNFWVGRCECLLNLLASRTNRGGGQ